MKINQVKIGGVYAYYPANDTKTGNKHCRAVVEKIGKRVTVRLVIPGCEGGVRRVVSARSLVDQLDLFEDNKNA